MRSQSQRPLKYNETGRSPRQPVPEVDPCPAMPRCGPSKETFATGAKSWLGLTNRSRDTGDVRRANLNDCLLRSAAGIEVLRVLLEPLQNNLVLCCTGPNQFVRPEQIGDRNAADHGLKRCPDTSSVNLTSDVCQQLVLFDHVGRLLHCARKHKLPVQRCGFRFDPRHGHWVVCVVAVPINPKPVKERFIRGDGGQWQCCRLCKIEGIRFDTNDAFIDQLIFGVEAGSGDVSGIIDLIARFEECHLWPDDFNATAGVPPQDARWRFDLVAAAFADIRYKVDYSAADAFELLSFRKLAEIGITEAVRICDLCRMGRPEPWVLGSWRAGGCKALANGWLRWQRF